MILPHSLHSLTFGNEFNQSLEHVILPHNLHSLTFGRDLNQIFLENATFPADLTFRDATLIRAWKM